MRIALVTSFVAAAAAVSALPSTKEDLSKRSNWTCGLDTSCVDGDACRWFPVNGQYLPQYCTTPSDCCIQVNNGGGYDGNTFPVGFCRPRDGGVLINCNNYPGLPKPPSL